MNNPPNRHRRIADDYSLAYEKHDTVAMMSKVLHAELRPRTFLERVLVETIALNILRQSRLRNFEKILLDAQALLEFQKHNAKEDHILSTARAFRSLIDQSRALSLIIREDSRCSAVVADSLRLLAEYRKARGCEEKSRASEEHDDTPTPDEIAFDQLLDPRKSAQ